MNYTPSAYDVRAVLYKMNLPDNFLSPEQIDKVLEQVHEDDKDYERELYPPGVLTLILWTVESMFSSEIEIYTENK